MLLATSPTCPMYSVKDEPVEYALYAWEAAAPSTTPPAPKATACPALYPVVLCSPPSFDAVLTMDEIVLLEHIRPRKTIHAEKTHWRTIR